jgi:5-methyltetrahydropteroyltriglutamate--homocysteine methyltransferase
MINARVEHTGSLLRPPYLQQAREARAQEARAQEAGAQEARAQGRLTADEFKAVEDHAVREVVTMQEEAGLPVVNDGELRRDSFQAELAAACDGFTGVGMDAWLWGDWHSAQPEVGDQSTARPGGLAVTGKLHKRRNLAAEEFTFVRACTNRQAKVTLPSPSLFANLWSPRQSSGAYPTLDAFLDDVVAILCEEVRELVRLGCGYIQLDAPHYPLLLDPVWREFYEQRGWPLQRWLSYGIELDNAVIEAGRPATFGFHLCRGNQLGRWLVAGDYEPIAGPIFGGVHADRLLLEYDDERSGGFDPLRLASEDKVLVLGLVTTKTSRVETAQEITDRLAAAARLVGADRLAVSPQCGFATSVQGNPVSPAAQRAKLAQLVTVANDFFHP